MVRIVRPTEKLIINPQPAQPISPIIKKNKYAITRGDQLSRAVAEHIAAHPELHESDISAEDALHHPTRGLL